MQAALEVFDITCSTCGGQWIHSHVIHRVAANSFAYASDTKQPTEIVRLVSHSRTTPKCHYCTTGEYPPTWPAWTEPEHKPAARPTKRVPTLEELLE